MRPYADIPKEDLLKMKEKMISSGENLSVVNHELRQRELEENIKTLTKPHWTLVPILFLSIASLVIALLAYFRPPQPAVPSNEHTISSSPATTMTPHLPTGSTQKKPVSQSKRAPMKP